MVFLKDKEAAAYQKTHRKHTEQQNKLPSFLSYAMNIKWGGQKRQNLSVEQEHQLTEFWQAPLHKAAMLLQPACW